jgi:hypothetical protein
MTAQPQNDSEPSASASWDTGKHLHAQSIGQRRLDMSVFGACADLMLRLRSTRAYATFYHEASQLS